MRNRVVILGWGSLIWDLDNLAPHVSGDWVLRAGPALPLEFSRVSPKRKLGLVVCIDPELGAACPTHAIASVRRMVAEAREDLARRERAPLDMIGVWCAGTGLSHGRAAPQVAEWCAAVGARGAVWTDLRPNFEEHAGAPFSLDRGEEWLRALPEESLDEAVRYIELAPPETDTPMRRHLSTRPWWRAEAARRLSPVASGPRSEAPPPPAPEAPPSRR
ncbi:MAG: hypothetical protein ACQEUZ_06895 [Pseudomonadota bacterium]